MKGDKTITLTLTAKECELLESAINTACCALHKHLDFSTVEKAEETRRSVWGREWRDLGNLRTRVYDKRMELVGQE